MAESRIPGIIVLALGVGASGFPDALRLLVDLAGRSPLLDIATCVLAMAVVTAHVLGTILLARFVRKAPVGAGAPAGGDGPAPRRRSTPPTDLFARMTLVVSLGAASLVSTCLLVFACLLAAPGSGGLALLYDVVDIVGKSGSPVVSVLVAIAAVLACATRPLLRALRGVENAHGAAPASIPTPTATERCANATRMGRFAFAGLPGAAVFLLLVVSGGGHYMHRTSLVSVSVGVAAVLGAMLLTRFTREAHNAAAVAGGRAAPTPPRDTRRFAKLVVVSLAVFCALVTRYYAPIEREPAGAQY